MAEIYKKNRPWLFAVIKDHLPEVISRLCDEDILTSEEREEVTELSQQTTRLLDVIQKKIISSSAPFDFTINFARALEKTRVSSRHTGNIAYLVEELEERQKTVVARKTSLPGGMDTNAGGDGKKEAQSDSTRRASTGNMIQPGKQVSERRLLKSESSSSGISDGSTCNSRKSSFGSNSSLTSPPDSARNDSGLDRSHELGACHVSTIRRQISQNLTPINEQVPSEVNVMNESGIGIEDNVFEVAQLESEEYHETKEDENCLPPPEDCSESNPTRVEMSIRKQSTNRFDRFVDSVLKAAQDFCQEDEKAASKEFHEMNQLYRDRISELNEEVSSLRHNLQESEQHVKDAEHEKELHTMDIQEKERRISQREVQLSEKEKQIYKMKEEQKEMRAKIKRTENEVDRLRNQLSRQSGRKKLESLKELMDLLEKADDPRSIKAAINQKINTLKCRDRPSTAHV